MIAQIVLEVGVEVLSDAEADDLALAWGGLFRSLKIGGGPPFIKTVKSEVRVTFEPRKDRTYRIVDVEPTGDLAFEDEISRFTNGSTVASYGVNNLTADEIALLRRKGVRVWADAPRPPESDESDRRVFAGRNAIPYAGEAARAPLSRLTSHWMHTRGRGSPAGRRDC